MKLQQLPFLMIVLISGSCMWGVPHSTPPNMPKDTLAYHYKKHDLTNPSCSCEATIKYPIFQIQQIQLNNIILNKLALIDTTNESFLQMSGKLFRAYVQNRVGGTHHTSAYQYYVKKYISVIHQDSSLITFKFQHFNGDNIQPGNLPTEFINWNIKANKSIALSDILVNGYEDKLTKIADSIFRKQEKLSETAPLIPNYSFKNGKFALNSNFLITPLGIRFLYNESEIKPKAAGQTNLLIPYTKIKPLLLPRTVVSQYIK